MQSKYYPFAALAGIIFAGAIFFGCEKQVSQYPSDTTSAQDDAVAAFVVQDVRNICNGAVDNNAIDRVIVPCSTVSRRDTNGMADSLLDINFGSTDCTSPFDGRIRRGHILAWYAPGTYYNIGSNLTIAFSNYYINDIGITGTCTISNTGPDSASIQTWRYTANFNLTYAAGKTATWASQRSCVLTKIGGKFYYGFVGTANGTCRSGATYNLSTANPLYIPAISSVCEYFEQGQVNISVSTFTDPIYVTYGTGIGNCNNTAKATIDGYIYAFVQQ